jgi:energy-coupling factor transport system substrate-specific component
MSWIAASFALLGLALAAGFGWYEREHPTTRVLALVATLAALAALGRVAFAPLPNVKPTTDIVLLAGYALGGAPGFTVGAIAALASNLFFGQGPWTPWQMAGWGLCGLLGAGLARVAGRELGRIPLALACALAGAVFGAVMNASMWVMYSGDHTAAKLAATFGTSLPFDVAHVAGNVTFCLVFGPALVRALARFRTRMHVEWLPAATAGAAVALAAVVLFAPAEPARADATANAARSSQSWLL